jgi:hypothetical protein
MRTRRFLLNTLLIDSMKVLDISHLLARRHVIRYRMRLNSRDPFNTKLDIMPMGMTLVLFIIFSPALIVTNAAADA